MKQALFGLLAALGLHAVVFLFGGFLIPKGDGEGKKKEVLVEVDVSKEEDKKEEEEPKEKMDEPAADIEQEMPDFRELSSPAASPGPALAAVSLSDLGSALSGVGGEGGFGPSVGFGSGVIGGSGSGGMGGMADMLSSGQLDNKPEPISRVSPKLNAEQRARAKGVVKLLLIVGPDGSVSKAEVTETPDPSVNAPCVEAARQWRFKPGMRGGKPVSFKLKLPFRFE
ncbi:TonB family protein [Prosthecobacter fusiformis]|uniref:TonB family protein n=1 Tax=Prosthecobacter fusiformis TaxID=48464 RepID=A0A4R7S3D9_9BACT|nr:energy transducer TonB [Prosthecobacter fusiformis]TDU72902.1 TonB family protein [Prosthecobacter fusiformis]